MNTKQKPQCSNCRFHRRDVMDRNSNMDLRNLNAGLCCHNAPEPVLVEDCIKVTYLNAWAQFPITSDTMWCGEYEERG